MRTMILAAAAALALATGTAAQAGQWSVRWTGPLGGVYEGSGKCADDACQSSGTFTGPNGGVWRHNGVAHQAGPGQWSGEGAVTGPGGQSWKHNWSWSANGR